MKTLLIAFTLLVSLWSTATSISAFNRGNDANIFQAMIPGTSQKVTISGTSAQSTTLSGNTSLVRLFATTDTYVAFGASPTASTTTSMFLPGGIIEYYGVTAGTKIAGIQSSAGGTLFITEGQ